MSDKYQNEVTSVICRNIKSGHEKDYDDWLRRYLTFERKAPGYLGTTIILPGARAQIYGMLFTALPTGVNGLMGKFRRIPESARGSK